MARLFTGKFLRAGAELRWLVTSQPYMQHRGTSKNCGENPSAN
jgi:hypothetical protein